MPTDAAAPSSLSNPYWGDDWAQVRALWPLDPGWAHLNHGSFGAVTAEVTAAQDRWRARMAVNPMRYFLIDEVEGVAASRHRAAAFLGSDPDGVALVANATTAASTVLASVELQPNDEVLVTDHCYGAVRLAIERAAAIAGARVVEVMIPVHAAAPDITPLVVAHLTDRTRLIVVDHIASPTARQFPVGEIVAAAHREDVAVFVDGAHAPAQIDVDLNNLGADFWTGNFHKWPCAARGTAALYVAPRWRQLVRPLVTSWRHGEGFPAAFDDTGTQDQSAWLTLGDALDVLERLSPTRLRRHGAALAAYGQHVLADVLRISAEDLWGDDELWMRCVPLPRGVATTESAKRALWRRISDELQCEVAVTSWSGRGAIRISAHAYNAPAEYDRLAVGLRALL